MVNRTPPANLPAIFVDPEALGPAMLELTEKQQKFVIALLEIGGDNESRAAAMAGYGSGYDTRAYELVRNPKVLAAIREEADKRLRSGALMASSMLTEIAKDRKHKDQFKACVELLNRGGLIVQTQHKVIVEDNRSDSEIIARVAAFAKELDIDPAKLLAKVGVDYEEGQFTEVASKIVDAKPDNVKLMLESPQKARTSEHDNPFADMMGPATHDEEEDDDA